MREPDQTNRLASLIEAAMDTRGGDALGIAQILIGEGVFYPPRGAERTEGRMIALDASDPAPYGDLEHSEGRMYYADGTGARRDVTDAMNAWAARQPGVLVVTFEWPEPPPICPECRDGKHGNCGDALHDFTDEIVPCRCDHGATL
ncbi:hypothetical protein [Microbacterium phage MO526]|uniref:Uncharacterized protein n=1 Tax=Microbacterium phage MO526 TaxID=3108092 RepID=A0ABZ0ZX10_9CAUD|nr:hypothetical protein [Microbacterium phage MO526]